MADSEKISMIKRIFDTSLSYARVTFFVMLGATLLLAAVSRTWKDPKWLISLGISLAAAVLSYYFGTLVGKNQSEDRALGRKKPDRLENAIYHLLESLFPALRPRAR
jgi:hypothetical protein